jgi:hypothetical protein
MPDTNINFVDMSEFITDEQCFILTEASLIKIESFDFLDLQSILLSRFIVDYEELQFKISAYDKFMMYRSIWKAIVERFYVKHLPHVNYRFKWDLEVTPYSLFFIDFLIRNNHYDKDKIDDFQQKVGVVDETTLERVLGKIGLNLDGIWDYFQNNAPKAFFKKSRVEQILILLDLLVFPPLEQLALFSLEYNKYIKLTMNKYNNVFSRKNVELDIDLRLSLARSINNIPHNILVKYGWDAIKENENLIKYKSRFEDISTRSLKVEVSAGSFICSCCGEQQPVNLPEDFIKLKLLLEDRELSNSVGIEYLVDYIEEIELSFKDALIRFFQNNFSELNSVDQPGCFILVEGESETQFLPFIAFKNDLDLKQRKIKVFNCQSKEKLYSYFLAFKEKFPNLRMVCLLDSDARKEFEDITRIIKGNLDKYRLVYIKNGCFEDLFDLHFSVKILNEIYTDGEKIVIEDFDPNKDFNSNIKKILHEKRRDKFDKVKFASFAALRIEQDEIPAEVQEVIKCAKILTDGTNLTGRIR